MPAPHGEPSISQARPKLATLLPPAQVARGLSG